MTPDNRRIAKNTIALYIRTFITLCINVYTNRVLLEALGIDNYGIFNVVGSVVAFSTILSGSMSSACSRYITYALGENNLTRQITVFTTSVNAMAFIAVLMVIVLEIGGIWFLNSAANLPPGRLQAAQWVLQCSIISTMLSLLASPSQACIIAHEKMSVYAYLGILEVCLKLGICFLVIGYGGDRLIFYATLLIAVSITMALFNILYSRIKFPEARYSSKWNWRLLKEMASFSGWTLFSNTTWVLTNQGASMLINHFFGVIYNATLGIANMVTGSAQAFVNNFTMSFTPQITKTYAAGENQKCFTLVNRAARFTWILVLLFMVPLTIEAPMVLKIWLVEVPPMAALFIRLSLFVNLAISLGQPYLILFLATGKVKKYSIAVSIYGSLVFPITWIIYWCGGPVWLYYVVFMTIYYLLNFLRLSILRQNCDFPWMNTIKNVYLPCIATMALAFIVPLFISFFIPESWFRLLVVVSLSFISTSVIAYWITLTSYEKEVCRQKLSALCLRYIPIRLSN